MTILLAILAIGALILVHELGHFLVARGVGMKVESFSVGFGPALLSFHDKRTTYRIGMLPLGGYVRIAGMVPGDGSEPDDPASFMNKPAWQRFLVIFAGPFINWLFAFLLLSAILMVGYPQPSDEPVVGRIANGSAAAAIGLLPGDRILSVGGEPIQAWSDLQGVLGRNRGRAMPLEVSREGRVLSFTARTGADGRLGVYRQVVEASYPFPQAFGVAFVQTGTVVAESLKGFGKLLRGEEQADLMGPVGIVSETAEAARGGPTALLSFLVFISLALAVMNLLPLPALDGGRLVFIAIAMVRRRPVDPKVEAAVHAVGLLLLLGLILFATYGDVRDQVAKRGGLSNLPDAGAQVSPPPAQP